MLALIPLPHTHCAQPLDALSVSTGAASNKCKIKETHPIIELLHPLIEHYTYERGMAMNSVHIY